MSDDIYLCSKCGGVPTFDCTGSIEFRGSCYQTCGIYCTSCDAYLEREISDEWGFESADNLLAQLKFDWNNGKTS